MEPSLCSLCGKSKVSNEVLGNLNVGGLSLRLQAWTLELSLYYYYFIRLALSILHYDISSSATICMVLLPVLCIMELMWPYLQLPNSFHELFKLHAETPGEYADGIKQRNPGLLAISGVQLSMLPFTQMSFFTDKKLVQRSTTALGYIAHVCLLSFIWAIFSF